MSPKRKEIARYGRRGNLVRVVLGTNHGAPAIIVLHPKPGGGRGRAFFGTSKVEKANALAFAEGFFKGSEPRPAENTITLEELWQRFAAAEFPVLRAASKRNYLRNWKRFENFAGPHLRADDQNVETMMRFRVHLEQEKGLAVNTIRKTMDTVRHVYGWGVAVELLTRSRVGRYVYKVAKEKRPVAPDEFRLEEAEAILASLNPAHGAQWRAWVALTICTNQGARQTAVLHLKPEDCDLQGGRLRWAAEWDKNGREWWQPMREKTRAALEVALAMRARFAPGSAYLLPGYNRQGKDEPYTIGALWRALVAAEKRAKVAHRTGRGGHGLRRLLAGEVAEFTRDPKLAMDAIGDRDIRQLPRYVKAREDRLAEAFRGLDERSSSETAAGGKTAPEGGAKSLQ